MKYNYRHKQTYDKVLEAIIDLENLLDSSGHIDTNLLLDWKEIYKELHESCLRDRYHNSCFKGFPCEHTENNIEYGFAMLYYELKTICEWKKLNLVAKLFLPKLLTTAPDSFDEVNVRQEVYDLFGNITYEIRELEIQNDSFLIQINYMNFGGINVLVDDLKDLYELSKLIEYERY